MPIRPLVEKDIPALKKILESTGVFKAEEVRVAVEMMETVVQDRHQEDYTMFSYADEQDQALGYYCVGQISFSDTAFDLYWIATDPKEHGKGIGTKLIEHCESFVRSRNGKLLIAETSSRPSYEQTRMFYEKRGYEAEARIKNYYSLGDDLVVYSKTIQEAQ